MSSDAAERQQRWAQILDRHARTAARFGAQSARVLSQAERTSWLFEATWPKLLRRWERSAPPRCACRRTLTAASWPRRVKL
jgi:hypothetical protein